ncbi:hypothetical protein ACCO45_005876 [Purpureocillium lilacinum]|uniref:Uncharacterized protein n=1 Tax=Purpureocillium lilacinum TaxID=33203 RepID=A0ACC4DY00_PURLI
MTLGFTVLLPFFATSNPHIPPPDRTAEAMAGPALGICHIPMAPGGQLTPSCRPLPLGAKLTHHLHLHDHCRNPHTASTPTNVRRTASFTAASLLLHTFIPSTSPSHEQPRRCGFHPAQDAAGENPQVQATIKALSLIPHMEGGYFAVTDVSEMKMPSPYPAEPLSQRTVALAGGLPADYDPALRRLSTTIFYYLTPNRPTGSFHRNRSRIIHTWHRGRGCYVLIHPDGRVETFVVGPDVEKGERLQWIVEGGVWKASHLVDRDGQGRGQDSDGEGLLITETVVPGFEYADHEFLSQEKFEQILPEDRVKELGWLVKH